VLPIISNPQPWLDILERTFETGPESSCLDLTLWSE
jgi:hypothetical protein